MIERLTNTVLWDKALSPYARALWFGAIVLAAPVLDADGVPLAALSVAAPAFAMPLKAFDAASRKPVMAAAAKLSRAVQAAGAGVSPMNQRQTAQ